MNTFELDNTICCNYIQTQSGFVIRDKFLQSHDDNDILDVQKLSDNENNITLDNEIPTLKRTFTFPKKYNALVSNIN